MCVSERNGHCHLCVDSLNGWLGSDMPPKATVSKASGPIAVPLLMKVVTSPSLLLYVDDLLEKKRGLVLLHS